VPEPMLKAIRKVWYRNAKNTSPAVAIPRWWLSGDEKVGIEVYPNVIVIRRLEKKQDVEVVDLLKEE